MSPSERTTPRKQAQQERSRATVEAILTAAIQVLLREGYAATTTTRVAEVAGVSVGTLYQYFPAKEALVAALVDQHLAQMRDVLLRAMPADPTAPLDQMVRTVVRALLQQKAASAEIHAALARQLPQVEGIERLRSFLVEMTATLRAFLETQRERIRPVSLDLAALVVVESVEAVALRAIVSDTVRIDDPALEDELTLLVVGYLSPRR